MKLWTDKKLHKLTDRVDQLTVQVQQMGAQMSELGQRIDQTRGSIDQLVDLIRTNLSQSEGVMTPSQQHDRQQHDRQLSDLLNRFNQIEQQMLHLSNRVNYLESRNATSMFPQTQPVFSEDEIEDEPDEILWDFMEPAATDESTKPA